MAKNEITQVVQLDPTFNRATLAGALLKRAGYSLLPSEDSRAVEVGPCRTLFFLGVPFERDDADTTSPHDGVTCLVSQEGTRFKASTYRPPISVLGEASAPPPSPAVGSAYLISTAPTGAFAPYANRIATFTNWGWRYTVPVLGSLVYVEATSSFKHYSTDGTWKFGLGTFTSAAGSIEPASLLFPLGVTVALVTNAPPTSPTEGQAVLVGTVPTGAFSGYANAVAVYRASTWVFITPYEGSTVWNAAAKRLLTFSLGAWASSVPQSPLIAESSLYSVDTALSCSGTAGTPTVAPTTASGTADFALQWRCSSATNRLRFVYSGTVVQASASFSVGLFKNSELAAQDWRAFDPVASSGTTYGAASPYVELFHAPGDTNLHQYTIRVHGSVTCVRRRLYVQEISS